MEKQLSIIIPTYNMEAYIGKCLDSLLIPEFDQVEVLVVNDGSKDRSSEIAHSYAERYPDSIRVIDKPNGNYGSCINAALPQCTGRYVKILDADDTFDTNAFSEFVRKLQAIDTDAVITEYKKIDSNGNCFTSIPYYSTVPEYERPIETNKSALICGQHYINMHRLSYKLDLLKGINYIQTEGISYTDTEWAIIPLYHCKDFTCFDLIVYCYLIGREGQTMSPEQLSKSVNQLSIVFKHLVDFYVDYPDKAPLKKSLFVMTLKRVEYFSFVALKCWNENVSLIFKDFDQYLKHRCYALYEDSKKITYDPQMNFKFVEDIRNKNYPQSYRIPLIVRAILSIKLRLNSFRKRIIRQL